MSLASGGDMPKLTGLRGRAGPCRGGDINVSSLLSLAKYECDGQADEYQHGMIMNGLAFDVTVALIAAGVWLAADLRG
jgi:hypothetical protein